MDYIVIRVDMDKLGEEATRQLTDEAARFDVDIDVLTTEMPVDVGVAIVVSTALALLVQRLGGKSGAPGRLWELLRRPIENSPGAAGVLDQETRVTFVWDRAARQEHGDAVAAMTDVCQSITSLPYGTVLRWTSTHRCWTNANQPTIVILTALPLEYAAVRRILPSRTATFTHPAGTVFEMFALTGAWQLALAFVGRGGYGTAVLAERAITSFAPSAVIFVGIAGALRPDLHLGDVVVATHVHPFQIGREDPTGFKAQPRTWAASPMLVQLAHQVAQAGTWREVLPSDDDPAPRVVLAPIAAGEIVLNAESSPSARTIREHFSDAAAIEMESAGLAAAVMLNPAVAALPIRGISDYADGHKDETDEDGRNQPRAAGHAAAFAYALVHAIVRGDEVSGIRLSYPA